MNTSKSQSGFSHLVLILLIVVIGCVGFAGWKVYSTGQEANKSSKLTRTSNNSASSEQKPASPNLIRITELGIQFTVPDTLNDLEYFVSKTDNNNSTDSIGAHTYVYLGTKKLDSMGCPTASNGDGVALGFLSKTIGQYPQNPTAENTTGTLIKQYPDYYIAFRNRGFACFDDSAKNQILTESLQQLKTALNTVEQIN